MGVEVLAPAKVNLFLEVLSKRKNGYHEIETIMQSINLYDSIILEEEDKGIKIDCKVQGVPSGKRNLVYHAANLLSDFCSIDKGVVIKIEKKIPVAAGLGGGSSDAASVLIGLNNLWKLRLSNDTLIELGTQLGADVPFFINKGLIMASGIGQDLTSLPSLPKIYFILITPHLSISTGFIYRNLELAKRRREIEPILEAIYEKDLEKLCLHLYNALEKVVIKYYPIVNWVKDNLRKEGAMGVLMSGSGPTVFGIAKDKEHAYSIYNRLKGGDYFIQVVESING
ncbi:MAG: 4-(cytidine 5'-diphospho)-2-C-methyl-D-erythritol kinase [bacterium]|nr:4-(cytidine 5'-diphospho)-2-C-methyl-D-erythritol kinase [bacterium]